MTVKPGAEAERWPDFLERFHRERAGITEDTLGRARSHAMSPYQWTLQPVPPTGRVLDLACGNGPLYPSLPDRWVGVDLSTTELGLVRRRGANVAVRGDAVRIPIASASCSAVVCSMALMILPSVEAVLAEVARVLSPTGVVVVTVPGTLPLTARDLLRYARLMVSLRQSHLGYPNDRPLARLGDLARAAGLTIVDDHRRRFALPLPDAGACRQFVESLYLPGVPVRRVDAAADLAARWAGTEIGIPLRRVTLHHAGAPTPSDPENSRRSGG